MNKLLDIMKEMLHKKSLVFIQYESMNKILEKVSQNNFV